MQLIIRLGSGEAKIILGSGSGKVADGAKIWLTAQDRYEAGDSDYVDIERQGRSNSSTDPEQLYHEVKKMKFPPHKRDGVWARGAKTAPIGMAYIRSRPTKAARALPNL